MANFEDLKGKVLTNIERVGDEELIFTCQDGIWPDGFRQP